MLIDTHVLLWYLAGDRRRIGAAARERIEAGATVSIAGLWEAAIKIELGKLEAPDDLPQRIEALGFELLPVTAEHAWAVRRLPRHHSDPFDRLMVAQAQIERLPILTGDSAFDSYDVMVIHPAS